MIFDQFSVLVAIGFSSASLGITLFMMWAVWRSETHLFCWSMGLATIVAGVVLFGWVVEQYDADVLLASFILLIFGFVLVFAGSAQFCSGRTPWLPAASILVPSLVSVACAFTLGYSGVGTMIANGVIGLLMTLSAYQYWVSRSETPLLMSANAVLYLLTAISFFACTFALMQQGQIILWERPSNWAEDLNSIVVIVGLTGIGTLSLTLNQARIADQRRSEALTDVLTGINNRRALFETWPNRIAPGIAMVMMDLDYFKQINDRFGHEAGDRVLRKVAELILSCIRSGDFAARIGGEEFCVILPAASQKIALSIADRIRSQVEAAAIPTSSGPIRFTGSFGIAVCVNSGETLQSLFNRADAALYLAKSSGRNRIRISDLSLVA